MSNELKTAVDEFIDEGSGTRYDRVNGVEGVRLCGPVIPRSHSLTHAPARAQERAGKAFARLCVCFCV
jgi:hypothetical protein